MNEGKIIGLTGQGNIVEALGKALEQVIHKSLRQIIVDVLSNLDLNAGMTEHIRSDNVPGFTSGIPRKWLTEPRIQTAYIVRASY